MAVQHNSSLPVTISPSKDEVDHLQLSPQNLEIAIRSLHKDGLVVIENVVGHASLDALNKVMIRDAYALRDKPDSPFNYNPGNIQQDPPPVLEHFHKQIFLSESNQYWHKIHYLTLTRSGCIAGHFYLSWATSKMDILLRKYSDASDIYITSAVTTCAYGR